jgi:transposase
VSRYITYNPDQTLLLPPSVRDELGEGHLAVFVHGLVERLDLSRFEAEHAEAGRPSYPPQLLLKVWLYAYALGVTSSRRIEQRIHEDLGFRFLAGGWKPDHWTLNEFRKRHPKALNDVFTQVVEAARRLGMGQLGRVAIDSTRVQATPHRIAVTIWNSYAGNGRASGKGFDAGKSSVMATIRSRRAVQEQRPGSGSNGSTKFRGRSRNCVNPDSNAARARIRRAAICAGAAASVWGIRRRWRYRTTI